MNKKIFNYFAIALIAVACNTKKPALDISAKEQPTKNNKQMTGSLDINLAAAEEEALVKATDFNDKFFHETEGKTWKDADASYKSDMQQYAQEATAKLRGLRKSYFLILAGQPTQVLKLVYDGTQETKNAILFYLLEIEQLIGRQPEVNLHFLQQAQQFMTAAETKLWAQKMAAWSNKDYDFWQAQNATLEAQSSMTDLEKSGYEMTKKLLVAIKQIRLIAQN